MMIAPQHGEGRCEGGQHSAHFNVPLNGPHLQIEDNNAPTSLRSCEDERRSDGENTLQVEAEASKRTGFETDRPR